MYRMFRRYNICSYFPDIDSINGFQSALANHMNGVPYLVEVIENV